MTNALKLLLISAATVITCVVIQVGSQVAKSSRQLGFSASDKMTELSNRLSENDLLMYDGLSVTGSDVVNLIKKTFGNGRAGETSITVISSSSPEVSYTYEDASYLEEIQNFTSSRYIKPASYYTGKIVRNENEVITEIIFTIE